jgi:formimidoylglutamate deiminase
MRILGEKALLPTGWSNDVLVTISADGRIADVQANAGNAAYDARYPVLLPAPANLHSHTFQRAMAGLTETRSPSGRDSFWTWRELMYRFLDLLSADDIEAIAAFAFMEMLEAGFGSVAEFHYVHHAPGGAPYENLAELSKRIASAASESGIGLTLLPVFYRYGGLDRRPLAGGQQRFGNDLERYAQLFAGAEEAVRLLGADANLGIAPHSLRATAKEDLAELVQWRPGVPFHMHIAEQEREVEEVLAATGRRPVEWLLENFGVDGRWCLIHATHMTSAETEGLAKSGAVAGLCPVTEANLGDGIFDGARFLQSGGRFGVGSDSNIRITVAEELRQLEYSQRLRDRARAVLADPDQSTGRRLFETALRGGAQALGRHCGVLESGAWADIIALNPSRFAGSGKGDGILDGWIFTGGNDAVTDVWSAGRHMVREGRHVHRERIERRYAETLAGIMARI